MKVINALQVKLTSGDKARVLAKGTENLQAYLKYLQAVEIFFTVTKEGNAQARFLLDEVIALDPQYPSAYGLLASIHFMDASLGISKSPGESLKQAFESIKKAIALDDTNATFHSLLGWLYILMEKQYDKGIAECERAIALAPNSSTSHIWMGLVLTCAGKPEEAVRYAEQALRLDPITPGWYYRILGLAYSSTGRYEEAIAALRKALSRTPNDLIAHANLTSAYSWAGRHEEARAQATEVLRINPSFSIEQRAKMLPYKNQTDLERYLEGLRKAGLKRGEVVYPDA
jgi:tetratricopeptide (TPR) repeat protein